MHSLSFVLGLDPIAFILLALFIGVPLLSMVVVGLFAVSAKFTFVEVKVRGGHLRGTIASALARVLVQDTGTIQLPLAVVLDQTSVRGRSMPLFGSARVQDIELMIYMDDEHVSTVTEARSMPIDGKKRRVELPVNADVHLPRGVIRAYRDYRAKKRRASEVKLTVRGHVIVRHWWMNRQIPVRLTRYVVVGEPQPRLASVRWSAVAGDAERWDRAEVKIRLVNGYHDEGLTGRLRVELRRRRRLLPDVLLAVHEQMEFGIAPKRDKDLLFETSFASTDEALVDAGPTRGNADRETTAPPGTSLPDAGPEEEPGSENAVSVAVRVFWDDHELTPEAVRVLGVPGAKQGPWLSTGLDGGKDSKKKAVAKLEPVQGSGGADRA